MSRRLAPEVFIPSLIYRSILDRGQVQGKEKNSDSLMEVRRSMKKKRTGSLPSFLPISFLPPLSARLSARPWP